MQATLHVLQQRFEQPEAISQMPQPASTGTAQTSSMNQQGCNLAALSTSQAMSLVSGVAASLGTCLPPGASVAHEAAATSAATLLPAFQLPVTAPAVVASHASPAQHTSRPDVAATVSAPVFAPVTPTAPAVYSTATLAMQQTPAAVAQVTVTAPSQAPTAAASLAGPLPDKLTAQPATSATVDS